MINTKFEILNPKQTQMIQTQNSKKYDLGDRTFRFAKIETGKQLIRSSGSIGANYIEAEESLSKKDFAMRIKISRKEAKESKYWLNLTESKEGQLREKEGLVQEATELMKIFGSIVEKCK